MSCSLGGKALRTMPRKRLAMGSQSSFRFDWLACGRLMSEWPMYNGSKGLLWHPHRTEHATTIVASELWRMLTCLLRPPGYRLVLADQ